MTSSAPRDHEGRAIDFGRVAEDYDRFRPGFPDSFFDRLAHRKWFRPGLRVLDLGTGTGSLALGVARRGMTSVGLDPSAELLEVARRRAGEEGLDATFVTGTAERTGQPDGVFDLVCAGQAWWWFDAPAALAEARRVLRPNGRIVIATFSYLPLPGNVAQRTESLILRHNPGWTKAGGSGLHYEQVQALDRAGIFRVESLSYVERVPFSHEAWRGRIRTCNGVGAALPPDRVAAFDRELAAMLDAECPGDLVVPHRIFVASGRSVGGRASHAREPVTDDGPPR